MNNDLCAGRGRAEMEAKIDDLCVHPIDRQIARLRLIDRQSWIDIGAEVHVDRRTAARRFDRIKGLL